MVIICYLSPVCSSEDSLKANIVRALKAEGIRADVSVRRIDEEEAARTEFSGSPSVVIDGNELQPLETTGFS